MGMNSSNGMSNGHGFGVQGMPQYQQQVAQHQVAQQQQQPTLGAVQAQQSISNQQSVPPPPSVEGASVSRAQVAFLVNGLKEETWERQLGEIRNVSRRACVP
jgi:hypothetical protein